MEKPTKLKILFKFHVIKSTGQLATLLNKVENSFLRTESNFKKIKGKHLEWLSREKDKKYIDKEIPKKNGKIRKIQAPDNFLKRTQAALNVLLQIVFEGNEFYYSNGFLPKRDIVRNAKPHANKKYLLNIDIENFFPSIEFRRIKKTLEYAPFNLVGERERLGFIIANIVTCKGVLPQGAPTSPIISNIVTQKLDRRINNFAKSLNIKYTRYADDLSFSSNIDNFSKNTLNKIEQIIISENFKLNPSKTRIQSSSERQEVTGLIVNQKVNIKRNYLKNVRSILYNWETKGSEYTKKRFLKFYKKSTDTDFREVLRGQINYIGLIKGYDNEAYKKLNLRFGILINQINYDFISEPAVQNKLIDDNHKMELILLDKIHSEKNRFISFCTSAFHQIENLVIFYYRKKFNNISDLLNYLMENNPSFKSKHKKPEMLISIKSISVIKIHYLIYLFEKEFYFDKKIYYNKEITMLRDIRNEDSHRSLIDSYDQAEIIKKHELLKIKWEKYREKHNGRHPIKPKNEEDLDYQYKLIKFLDSKNYNSVRMTIKKTAQLIKRALN